jgi:uncharacterized protein YndB with AHSA1/START domain
MAKIEASVMIDRPVEDVWKFMTNLSNLPKWDSGVLEAKQTSPEPLGVGSTFLTRHKWMTYSFRCSEYEPNHRFSFEFSQGPMKGAKASVNLEAIEEKTSAMFTIDPKIGGVLKLLGPYLNRSLRGHNQESAASVKRILESEAKP